MNRHSFDAQDGGEFHQTDVGWQKRSGPCNCKARDEFAIDSLELLELPEAETQFGEALFDFDQ